MNSVVQFRSKSKPDYQNGRVRGYHVVAGPISKGMVSVFHVKTSTGWMNARIKSFPIKDGILTIVPIL